MEKTTYIERTVQDINKVSTGVPAPTVTVAKTDDKKAEHPSYTVMKSWYK